MASRYPSSNPRGQRRPTTLVIERVLVAAEVVLVAAPAIGMPVTFAPEGGERETLMVALCAVEKADVR